MGPKRAGRRPQAVHVVGDGPSTSGENVGRSGGRKRGRDNDGGEDDPNK